MTVPYSRIPWTVHLRTPNAGVGSRMLLGGPGAFAWRVFVAGFHPSGDVEVGLEIRENIPLGAEPSYFEQQHPPVLQMRVTIDDVEGRDNQQSANLTVRNDFIPNGGSGRIYSWSCSWSWTGHVHLDFVLEIGEDDRKIQLQNDAIKLQDDITRLQQELEEVKGDLVCEESRTASLLGMVVTEQLKREESDKTILAMKDTAARLAEQARVRVAKDYTSRHARNHPWDVRFDFGSGKTLWESAAALTTTSPYFASLLSGNFRESVASSNSSNKKRKVTSSSGSRARQSDQKLDAFEDSDEEREEREELVGVIDVADDSACRVPYYHINVKSAAFTTYQATLCWIDNGFIKFASLSSSIEAQAEPSEEELSDIPAVSPKSVYRLADLLELEELKGIALNEFKRQLSSQNVAAELFGDVAQVFEPIKTAAMDYAIKHWDTVKESASMKEVQRLYEAGDLPEAGKTYASLAMKLAGVR